jgi:hypothetical protein
MAIPEIDKHKEYVRYAEHCLKTATVITYQKSRAILREMAAEWLTLADAVPRSRPRSHMMIVPGDRNSVLTRFGDRATVSSISLPANAVTFLEVLRFGGGHGAPPIDI